MQYAPDGKTKRATARGVHKDHGYAALLVVSHCNKSFAPLAVI